MKTHQRFEKLKVADMFKQRKFIETIQSSWTGFVFTLLFSGIMVSYAVYEISSQLGKTYLWDEKLIVRDSKVTGKFLDYMFDKNVTLAFGRLWSYDYNDYRPISEFGHVTAGFWGSDYYPAEPCISEDSSLDSTSQVS
jgi:hypothetical protein